MSNVHNVIQNPLLGAVQILNEFELIIGDTEYCEIKISPRDHTQRSLLEMLEEVRETLIGRMPQLAQREVQQDRLVQIRQVVADSNAERPEDTISSQQEEDEAADSASEGEAAESALFEEENASNRFLRSDKRPHSGSKRAR
jgi:hypothetical protein